MTSKLFCVIVMCIFFLGCNTQADRLKGVQKEFPNAEIKMIPVETKDWFIVKDSSGKIWCVLVGCVSATILIKEQMFEVSEYKPHDTVFNDN